jgi:tetratricopeptide (TPR) repeat protein
MMQLQSKDPAESAFERGREFLAGEDAVAALAYFEKALKLNDNPAWYSYLGYCVAKERGQVRKGIDLCQLSLEREQGNPVHYLNLGMIHLISGEKLEALRLFREGLTKGDNEEIRRKLSEIGTRKPPFISWLSRSNPLNKTLGFLLARFGFR